MKLKPKKDENFPINITNEKRGHFGTAGDNWKGAISFKMGYSHVKYKAQFCSSVVFWKRTGCVLWVCCLIINDHHNS